MTGLIYKNKSGAFLRRRRHQLVGRLSRFEAVLRGSLIQRYKPCGKPGCHCATGPGHGPKYYLSISRSGARPEMHYVPQGLQDRVERCLSEYRKVQEILSEIASINVELLKRRERF